MTGEGRLVKGQVTDMAGKKVGTQVPRRKEETDERPGRYRSALEEIRHELRELWEGPPYERGDKLPATLSREECRQLMTAYTKGKWAFRNNLISRVLYATGLRGEELENLKVCDVNYDQGTIFVRSGKGDKDRYVCCDGETFALIRKWGEEQKKGLEDAVIGLTVRQIRRIVEEAGELTGIAKKYEAMGRVFSSHSLRHAFATHCYENGMRTLTLKKMMGHEFLATTEVYLYTSMRYEVEEFKRVGPLGRE
ncbi:MAG: tyrosine-type recombinase/integrase [Candidatus Eremiobacteraeota bacterium]|nr:tyrosine-type recombinase/integrase [Candidatus Eremiobacteraeota bacterium]